MAKVSIEGFAKATKSKLGEASRAIKISLFTGVIRDTRVRTGRLRGNWQTSTGSPIKATTSRMDPTGQQASQEARNNATEFGVDYMTNNLPYAGPWEDEDGMIAKNMQRIERNVKEAVRRVRED